MAKTLSIVECAYRGTIEEQDDTVLWFNQAMVNAGFEVDVLLRGNAVNYAVRGQDVSGLRFGAASLDNPPHIDKDVEWFQAKNRTVYVVAEDLADRGIDRAELVEPVKVVPRAEVARIVTGYDRVYNW